MGRLTQRTCQLRLRQQEESAEPLKGYRASSHSGPTANGIMSAHGRMHLKMIQAQFGRVVISGPGAARQRDRRTGAIGVTAEEDVPFQVGI